MLLRVRPIETPRCSTSSSDCKRDTSASSTSCSPLSPSAMRSNVVSSCRLNSPVNGFPPRAEQRELAIAVSTSQALSIHRGIVGLARLPVVCALERITSQSCVTPRPKRLPRGNRLAARQVRRRHQPAQHKLGGRGQRNGTFRRCRQGRALRGASEDETSFTLRMPAIRGA